MLANVIKLVSGCVTFLGGFLVVWGAVSLGVNPSIERCSASLIRRRCSPARKTVADEMIAKSPGAP